MDVYKHVCGHPFFTEKEIVSDTVHLNLKLIVVVVYVIIVVFHISGVYSMAFRSF